MKWHISMKLYEWKNERKHNFEQFLYYSMVYIMKKKSRITYKTSQGLFSLNFIFAVCNFFSQGKDGFKHCSVLNYQ